MNPSNELPHVANRGKGMSCAAACVLIVLILAALVVFVVVGAERLGWGVAQRVKDVFGQVAQLQPRLTVNDRLVFEQSAQIAKLAVVTRRTQIEHAMEHAWLGSKKTLRLRGVYDVQSGFDLTKPFNARVEGRRIIVDIPPPQVLAVEQIEIEVMQHESGLWNKVKPQDVADELKALPALVREKAIRSGIEEEAVESLARQLRDRFGEGFDVEIRIAGEPVTLPAKAAAKD